MNVVNFPTRRRVPDTVFVEQDFGQWCIKYCQGDIFISRLEFDTKAQAEAEAIRLAKAGMTWRFGPNGTVYIFPDGTDGGCWAVAHMSRFGDSDSLLGRYFVIDLAIDSAICAARDIKAGLSLAVSA